MRRRQYGTASALRAFVACDGSDMDWAGALIVQEFIDDVRVIRQVAEGYAKAMSKAAKKGRRR